MSLRTSPSAGGRAGLTMIAGVALILGACTSSPGTSATSSTAASVPASVPASAAMSAEASADAGSGTVLAADTELGGILTDADGFTIYYFANDTEGVSNCTDDCLANWPAVTATETPEPGEGVTATLGTMTRDDGTTQLTVNGFPAYYFAADSAPGDTNGQAVNDVWWVFGVDGAPIES